MMGDIIEALALSDRPLFVDEADYLANSKRMTESLRDMHDMATVPVVLIGMAGIDQRLNHRKQLTGRLMADVRFQRLTDEDVKKLADELSDIQIDDALRAMLNKQAAGSARLVVVGLGRIEQWAKSRGKRSVTAADWGRKRFFTGEAPNSNGGKK
jgi:ribosomal protein S13